MRGGLAGFCRPFSLRIGTGLTDEDAVPELPSAPVSMTGDLWILGQHKLLCGDATSRADVERLMAGDATDLVFTDPPYNVDCEGYNNEKLTIKGDRMTTEQFQCFLQDAFGSYRAIVKQNAMETAGFEVRCQIIWAKNTFAWG